MIYIWWTIACLIAYIAGLAILTRVTPLLLVRAYDQGLFMAIAAADIMGGIFAFGAVTVTFALFSGNFGVKVLDFLLLVGIVIVGIRMSIRSFHPHVAKTNRVSRVVAGTYCLVLALAALYYLVLLFTSSS